MSIYITPRIAHGEKASPIGPGAAPLMTEFPLNAGGLMFGARSPQKQMQRAWALSFEVPWIAAAEDAITGRFGSVGWHLEDEMDAEVDDAYANADAQAAKALLEFPSRNLTVGAPFYRSDLWALTARSMGVCGSAFILLDQREALADTPAAMLPLAPWRLWPQDDAKGNLVGWWIDRTDTSPGVAVKLNEVLHFPLRRDFSGHFGIGLMRSAMGKLQLSQGYDSHLGMVLSAGGRLTGLLTPKQGGTFEPDQMVTLERDWRSVVEQADAAKRLQLIRAPVEFTKTALSPQELQIRDLMIVARDDLLAIWGVPYSMIGGALPSGLNSGDARRYDNAVLWQGPIHGRLNTFREVIQYQLLDRWQARGCTLELDLHEPTFDDDSTRYDLLGKSVNTPMTNAERRALIGLPPLGDPAIDDAILLPALIVPYTQAPIPADPTPLVATGALTAQVEMTPQLAAAGEQKARVSPTGERLHASLVRLRTSLDSRVTPTLRTAVAGVLRDQRTEIASAIRRNAAHIAARPRDTSPWWDARRWDDRLRAAIGGHLAGVAQTVSAHIDDLLPAKAGPIDAAARAIERGAARITAVNERTRAAVADFIAEGIDAGLSPAEVADSIESGVLLSNGVAAFDEYRAELIARTEMMDAYNGAALASYGDAGIEMVQAIDGDEDAACAARNGQEFPLSEADTIEDHPNGTLDWVPVFDAGKAAPMAAPTSIINVAPVINIPAPVINIPAPVVHVSEAPTIHVAAPVVNIEAAEPPVVNIPAPIVNVSPAIRPTTKTVERDDEGRITRVTEE